jgi:hypothetical protein
MNCMTDGRLTQPLWELTQAIKNLTVRIIALTKAVEGLRIDRQPEKEAASEPSTPAAEV